MWKKRVFVIPFLISLVALAVSACQGAEVTRDPVEQGVQEGVAATLTKEAFIEDYESARDTEQAQAAATQTPDFTATLEASLTPTSSPTPEPPPRQKPRNVPEVQMMISDLVTVDLAKNKTAIGDVYSWGRLERPYTRKSKYRKKTYIKASPNIKIVRFDMGNLTKAFPYSLQLKSKDTLQIRHNAFESARQSSNKYLETNLHGWS